MSDRLIGPGPTTLEAIAREVDHSTRGVNNCAYDAARGLSKAIRALGDTSGDDPEAVKSLAFAEFDRYLPTVDDPYGDIARLRQAIERVDPTDPMGPFSDKDKWWPRNAMTSHEVLEFYYARNPDKRPKTQASWADVNPYARTVYAR